MHAREIMTRNVLTVTPVVSLTRAAELLANRGYSALPVVDAAGVLVGMVTEYDLVRDRFPHDERHPERTDAGAESVVGDVMTTPTVALSPATDVGVIAHKMISAQLRCVPIVEHDRLVGVVTRHDIIRLLARSDADIAADVRARLELFGGRDRWTVDVHDGVARISDRYADLTDQPVAEALARSTPGVIRCVIHSGQTDGPTTQIPAWCNPAK